MNKAGLCSRRVLSIYHMATGSSNTDRSQIGYQTYTNSALPVPIQQHARKLISQRTFRGGSERLGWVERGVEMFGKYTERRRGVVLPITVQQGARKLISQMGFLGVTTL